MRKILVTGGAGFIASSLAAKLAGFKTDQILIVDDLSTGLRSKIPSSPHNNIRLVKADVNVFEDIAGVFFSFHPDYVFHYAAVVGVQRTLASPIKVLNDVSGIKNVLNLSMKGVKRVFFSSSSEVYGEPVEFPQNEKTTPLNSRLPYAIVKNIGESYLRSYRQEYGLNYTIFRFFNTYGPNQSSDFVVSKFISQALRGGDIGVFGDGSQTRTFCYVDDNIKATTAAFYRDEFVNDVVNIGSDKETTILDLARTIIKVTDSSSKIVHLPSLPEGDMTRRLPDATKMRILLGDPYITLEEGLIRILHESERNSRWH